MLATDKELGLEMKLELVPIPGTDVDRAKAFYVDQVGFNPDHDHIASSDLRFVQLTPPGSACSIVLGVGITEMAPGSAQSYQIIVANAEQARAELLLHGVEVSEVQEMPWGKFVFFKDPDGNGWALQELPPPR